MAPALTKILKDGHGIHLSSPAVRMDSDERAMCSAESQIWSADDGDLQKLWLNLSLFPSLDSGLPARPLDVSGSSPFLQASQCETAAPSSSASLLSFSQIPGHSHQVACVFPGVPNMFFVPVAEHNSQDASLLHGCSAAPECRPDGGDVHHSPLIQTSVPMSHSHVEMNSQSDAPLLVPRPTPTQGEVPVMHRSPPSPLQPCSSRMDPEKLASSAVLEAAVKEQASRQAGLHSRAQGLQKRLQALLGEHATHHCTQQLEGLKRQLQLGVVSLNSPDFTRSASPPHCPRLESHPAWSLFSELTDFCLSNQAVLRGLHEALDSEATASSSSDEEQELEKIHGNTKTSPVSSSSSERRWLQDRAELGSRWSWLQLRLAQLEGRVQQLAGLHQHIRSTKGGVVLAASQPLTDRQIQQTLLREMAGLTCTASDADAEPCSPTRLLQNIERQSAQLNQIVNSLMPPLSFSPLSKQSHRWRGNRDFTSCQNGDGDFLPGSSKRRKLWTRKLLKADVSCVCARTRPLVTYHKPKLFTFNSKSSAPPDLEESMPTLSSSLSSCSRCSTCDPTVLCSDPDCSSTSTKRSTPHSLWSLPLDTPLSQHSKKVPAREEWTQRNVFMNDRSSRRSPFNRGSSTPLHNSHTYKHHKRHRDRVLGLSPIMMAGSAQGRHRRANQRKGKRRHIHRLIQDEEEDVLYQVCHPDSSDEVLEESYTQVSRKQPPQGFVRKRQGESVYNIDNVVIPVSLTKVEKLQYKDILTPSWRVVDTSSLMSSGAEKVDEEGQVEDLANVVFTQRHLVLEQREKLRWSSWGKRKCCRRLKSSGSRLSGSRSGMCTSGEESSLEMSCAQLDTDEQQSTEEWLNVPLRQPQTPWTPRVFPLAEEEEDALLCDSPDTAPSGWSDDFSNSRLSPAPSSGATLLSSGQSQSCTSIVC